MDYEIFPRLALCHFCFITLYISVAEYNTEETDGQWNSVFGGQMGVLTEPPGHIDE